MSNESGEAVSLLRINSPITLTEEIRDFPDLETCDIIGDLHGCYDELVEMLHLLGHDNLLQPDLPSLPESTLPRILFVGDLVDRGDRNMDTLFLVYDLCTKGYARMVVGNHDYRFFRWLQGHEVKIAYGLDRTIAEFNAIAPQERNRWREKLVEFFEQLPYAIRFDEGESVMVHAAWRPRMKEETEVARIRYYAIYGPSTGEQTSQGFPVRIDWARTYKGPERVFFGHQVYLRPYRTPYAIGIDTGCVFGGSLTALRYPSLELVSVQSKKARATYNGPMIDPNDD